MSKDDSDVGRRFVVGAIATGLLGATSGVAGAQPAAPTRGRILAGAINDLKVVLDYSDPGLSITNVNKDPSSGLVTVTFSPTNPQPPVVIVSGIDARTPFVSHITNTSFIIGGSERFHFIAILRKP